MKKPYSGIVESVTNRYITSLLNGPTPLPRPIGHADARQMAEELFNLIVVEFEAANALQQSGSKHKVPDELPPYAIAMLFRYCFHVVRIDFGDRNPDNHPLALYIEDLFGEPPRPNKGTYSIDLNEFKRLIRWFAPTISRAGIKEVIDILETNVEHVSRCQDKNIIPVNNGLYNYETKQLMPFSPDYVFLTKTRVDYVDNPKNPIIYNPNDGTDWDVETWMQSLSDDPEVVKLLWQIIGGVVRPGESWDKAIFLISPKGNNGKGTFCVLLRNMCGNGAYISLQINDFDKDFMLENLPTACAIITDENDVDDYIDHAGNFKAVVTHDPININRKYKTPIPFRYTGIIVQCVNGFPLFRDKSSSLYRRILPVPFEKCFTGAERKYIKHDYLNRPEVLQYVLHKVLHMDYHEFSEPVACKQLLARYKTNNDPVRQFAEEFLPQFAWDLIPNQFLYDLYASWMKRFYPGTKPAGRNKFLERLRVLLPEYPDWKSEMKEYTSNGRMDKPELLIEEYDLRSWYNYSYQGPDQSKRCVPQAKTKYRGILRATAGSAAAPGDDDQ